MTPDAVFVDLANFYSRLLQTGLGPPDQLRDYFLTWLDFGRISEKLTLVRSPVWVFYSGRRIGPREARIDEGYLDDYIARLNNSTGVTAYDVNIPGRQREHATYHCDNCGHDGIAQWESEKGVDASLTVHMFDTADAWEVAYLLSGDADYVPAVASLRRRGKIVSGAGFANPAPSLVRECYQYVDLLDEFIRDDFVAYLIFSRDGLAKSWLTAPVIRTEGEPTSAEQVTLGLEVNYQRKGEYSDEQRLLSMKGALRSSAVHYDVLFYVQSPFPMWDRPLIFQSYGAQFPQFVSGSQPEGGRFSARLSPLAWGAVESKIDTILTDIPNLEYQQLGNTRFIWSALYRYEDSSGQYTLTGPQ